jgi:hypothetical protein
MKRFLISFLALLMLTPSLACAMSTCGNGDAQVEASTEQPCAGHHLGSGQENKNTPKVNLLLDCMGVDMQKADTASIDNPNLKKELVAYDIATGINASLFVHTNIRPIRAPPPEWSTPLQAASLIILTTQRFRI